MFLQITLIKFDFNLLIGYLLILEINDLVQFNYLILHFYY